MVKTTGRRAVLLRQTTTGRVVSQVTLHISWTDCEDGLLGTLEQWCINSPKI